MPSLLQTNLPAIMQATEQQLLTFLSAQTTSPVAGDISNIYWFLQGEEPDPGATGQRDILLAEHEDVTTNVQGAARFSEIYSGIDVYLRSSLASDRKGTKKDWMIANRALVEGVMDALMDFFPVDDDDNAYTIEGFVLDTNATPSKARDNATWGEVIGTYRFHYCPRVDTKILG